MDDVGEHARDLLARRPLARSQERQDRLARSRLEDVDRLEACAARVGVEQRQLLLAVHHVVGVVDVERDRRWRAGVAAAEQIDEAGADPVQRPGVGEVLQARDGRLAGQVVAAVRRTLAGDQQRRVAPQRVEVVGVLVAGGDRHHARCHHRPIGVDDEQRVALIGERIGDHGGEVEATGRLAQHHKPAVRGEVAGVPRSCERLR